LLVKEAFSKKPMPNFGLIDGGPNEVALSARNYIWQVSGYLQNEKALNGFHHNQRLQVRSKKQALVVLYKLWSGFTKNLRYLLVQKCRSAVRIPKFGTLVRETIGDEVVFKFSGSQELA